MDKLYPIDRTILLLEILQKLACHHSAMLWAYYLGGMNVEEIAEMSGLTTEAVCKRIQRALLAARTLISN